MVAIGILVIVSLFLALGWRSYRQVSHPKWQVPREPFPESWKEILEREVLFYSSLNAGEKVRFESKVQEFLLNCRIQSS